MCDLYTITGHRLDPLLYVLRPNNAKDDLENPVIEGMIDCEKNQQQYIQRPKKDKWRIISACTYAKDSITEKTNRV